MSDITPYTSRVFDTSSRANEVKNFAYAAQFAGQTGRKEDFITDSTARSAAIVQAASDVPLFEGVSKEIIKRVAPAWAESVREYALKHGFLPNNEMLANAHQACEQLFLQSGIKPLVAVNTGTDGDVTMFESVRIPAGTDTTSVSTGIMRQALFAAMIMPYTLGAATSDMATFVPCARDNSDLYMLRTVAGNTFGDLVEGQEITPHTAGSYSQMKRRSLVKETPDGTITDFTFKVPDAGGKDIPVRVGYTRLIVDGFPSENYDTSGKLTWYAETGSNKADVEVTATKGEFKVKFDTAPEEGTQVLVEYQINIEKRGDLIPSINQVMLRRTIKPSPYALAAEYTIQAMFDGRREFNIDVGASLLTAQRDVIAHEIDMARLRVAIDFTRYFSKFDIAVPLTLDWDKYISLLKGHISNESSKMANRNMVRGIRGIFAGASAAEVIKQLPTTEFKPASFSDSPRIQYIGRLFDRYNVYQVPEEVSKQFQKEGKRFTENSLLCYGRGDSIGEAGLVTGDAVPLLPIPHNTDYNLVNRNTMWGSMINDVNPFNGWEYFTMIELTSEKSDAYHLITGEVNKTGADDQGSQVEGTRSFSQVDSQSLLEATKAEIEKMKQDALAEIAKAQADSKLAEETKDAKAETKTETAAEKAKK